MNKQANTLLSPRKYDILARKAFSRQVLRRFFLIKKSGKFCASSLLIWTFFSFQEEQGAGKCCVNHMFQFSQVFFYSDAIVAKKKSSLEIKAGEIPRDWFILIEPSNRSLSCNPPLFFSRHHSENWTTQESLMDSEPWATLSCHGGLGWGEVRTLSLSLPSSLSLSLSPSPSLSVSVSVCLAFSVCVNDESKSNTRNRRGHLA